MSTNPQVVPFLVQKFLYINECKISNDATTPNTVLDISAGICRDQTDTYDLNLGNYDNFNNGQAANSVTLVNAAVNGINGLDTGSLAASTLYYVYVVADPVKGNPTGAMLSLAAPSVGPLMPFGYSASRHIGYAITDASSHILAMYNSGNNSSRVLTFDAPQATAVTAGNATSYTAVALTKWVPPIANLQVSLAYSYVPATAGNTLKLQGLNSTGDAVTITGQVATVHISGNALVLAQLTGGNLPEVNYKVGNSSDAVALNVAGFNYYI